MVCEGRVKRPYPPKGLGKGQQQTIPQLAQKLSLRSRKAIAALEQAKKPAKQPQKYAATQQTQQQCKHMQKAA